MATATVDVKDLAARFQELMTLASAGTEIILMEGNLARARIVPLAAGRTRVPGLHPGAITTTDDFDAPLPEEFWLGTA